METELYLLTNPHSGKLDPDQGKNTMNFDTKSNNGVNAPYIWPI
jgi:hypothetical protein